MQITEFQPDSPYHIQSYKNGEIIIQHQAYKVSLFVTATSLKTIAVTSIDQLTPNELNAVIAIKPEVLLIGTGQKQHFPPNHLLANLIDQQIGTEVMDTASACRTFNILLSESRHVAAILIINSS